MGLQDLGGEAENNLTPIKTEKKAQEYALAIEEKKVSGQ
jgi:hypothetical protein